jgi:hypothetical protein
MRPQPEPPPNERDQEQDARATQDAGNQFGDPMLGDTPPGLKSGGFLD